VFDELISDSLHRVSSKIPKFWHPVNHVCYQMEAIQIVPDNHVERRGRGPLLLVTPDMKVVVVGPTIGQAVDQPGVAVVGENDGFVGRE